MPIDMDALNAINKALIGSSVVPYTDKTGRNATPITLTNMASVNRTENNDSI